MRGFANQNLVPHSHFQARYFGEAEGLVIALGAGVALASAEGDAEAAGVAVAEASGEADVVALAAGVAEAEGLATGAALRASVSRRPVRLVIVCRAVSVVRMRVSAKKAPPR